MLAGYQRCRREESAGPSRDRLAAEILSAFLLWRADQSLFGGHGRAFSFFSADRHDAVVNENVHTWRKLAITRVVDDQLFVVDLKRHIATGVPVGLGVSFGVYFERG